MNPSHFLKFTIISLVLQTLRERERLLPWHHVAKSLTSSLWAVSSLLVMRQDGVVVHKLVGAVCGYTVMHVQEWTENTALRGSGAQGQYRGREIAHPHHLGYARQEVQDPVANGALVRVRTKFQAVDSLKPPRSSQSGTE